MMRYEELRCAEFDLEGICDLLRYAQRVLAKYHLPGDVEEASTESLLGDISEAAQSIAWVYEQLSPDAKHNRPTTSGQEEGHE